MLQFAFLKIGTSPNPAGKHYPKSDANEIQDKWLTRYIDQFGDYADICNEILARREAEGTWIPFPPYPLQVYPDATRRCVLGGNCYHRVYKTHDTSTSKFRSFLIICFFFIYLFF